MNNKNSVVKHERFKNVASKRIQKVLDSIDNLSKCSNKYSYEYSEEEVNKMLKAVKERVKMLENSFSEKYKSRKKTFEF